MSLKMFPKTKFIGITGGIGSGKSYVCRLLEQAGIPISILTTKPKSSSATIVRSSSS